MRSPGKQRRAAAPKSNARGFVLCRANNVIAASLSVLALCSLLLTLLLLPTLLRLDKYATVHLNVPPPATHPLIDDTRECFRPRPTEPSTQSNSANYSLPILNLGFPKGGSTSLEHYFKCGGLDTSHFKCRKRTPNSLGPNKWMEKGVQCGKCIRWTLHTTDEPLLERCGDYDVYTQLDVENDAKRGGCFFPQIQALDILHDENPTATFILTFRPVSKWIESLTHWEGFDTPIIERLGNCHNMLPGLDGTTPQHFADWWCGHVEYVRSFVEAHPGHKLLEVDIEANDAGEYMAGHLGIDANCWEHKNKNLLKGVADHEVLHIDEKAIENMPKWMRKDVAKKKKRHHQILNNQNMQFEE